MASVISLPKRDTGARKSIRLAAVSWLLVAVFYFYQYALRSAPSVMVPQLTEAFGLSALGHGVNHRAVLLRILPVQSGGRRGHGPLGAARKFFRWPRPSSALGPCCSRRGNREAASVGRMLQGAGGVFALVGAVYIATKNFPASRAATLIGATQMFGMAGGSAGQFVVGPMIGGGIAWKRFWIGMGVVGLAIGAILFFLLAKRKEDREPGSGVERHD